MQEGLLVCQWGRNTAANNKNALYLGCSSHAQALGSLLYSILRVACGAGAMDYSDQAGCEDMGLQALWETQRRGKLILALEPQEVL